MQKIAILNCLKANEVCTGASCLQAFYRRSQFFARYDGQNVELAAFMRCNGCGKDPRQDAGMQEKLERLKQEGVTAVHLGVCTKKRDGSRCPVIAEIAEQLRADGMEIVEGTH